MAESYSNFILFVFFKKKRLDWFFSIKMVEKSMSAGTATSSAANKTWIFKEKW